jgi:hypothetical protein
MRSNMFTRLLPVVAVAALATSASAQDVLQSNVTGGLNAAGERSKDGSARSAIFTQSAYTAPKGAFGLGLQAVATRASSDEGGIDASAMRSDVVVSAYYGVTDRISVGAFVPYTRYSLEIGDASDSETALSDAGLFARVAAFGNGPTRVAFGADVTLPTGDDLFTRDDPSYGVSAAMSHTAGKWNLHASPRVAFVQDFDMGINLNVAAVRSLNDRWSWSGEVLSQFGGAPSDVDGAEGNQEIDLASGVRYRFAGRTTMDVGMRYNLASQLDPKPTTLGAYLGFNWAF